MWERGREDMEVKEKVRKEAWDLGWVKGKSVWGQRIAGKLGIL